MIEVPATHPQQSTPVVVEFRPQRSDSSRSTAPRVTKQLPVNPVLGMAEGVDVELNLERLIQSRLFVQAAPGGGKSYVLRRVLEQTHSRIQQIVIDPEGELVTLAEQFDYLVLAADSEETPLRTAAAGELARTLWKSGHSVVLCLESMEVERMQEFVGAFLSGLMTTRKEDWTPLLLVIDEGQLFAPQQDKSESKKPMLDVAARGRKRGICPVVATQRVSQIHKGVVAHMQNYLIGLTTLDTDVERAADLLGIKPARAGEILRGHEPGEFLAYGPALGFDLKTVKIGTVQTQHGVLGQLGGMTRKRLQKREKVLDKVRELGTPPLQANEPPQGDKAEKDGKQSPLHLEIAEFRRWVVAPLLAKDAQRGALGTRCSELGLKYAEVARWLKAFSLKYDTSDLVPLRVRDAMRRDVVRLSTRMLQDEANHRTANPKLRRVA